MHKMLGAVLAAGITAPVLATNGQIINDAQAYMSQAGVDMSMPSVNLNLSQADIEYYMNHPEELLALVQTIWNDTNAYAGNLDGLYEFDGFGGFDGFRANSVPYANNPVFFGGYSQGEIDDLYEEAYPGYHQAMATYRQRPSSAQSHGGMSMGGFNGLGGASFQNIGGLNMGHFNGNLGGLMGRFPGYTSQAEFNDIVFDE